MAQAVCAVLGRLFARRFYPLPGSGDLGVAGVGEGLEVVGVPWVAAELKVEAVVDVGGDCVAGGVVAFAEWVVAEVATACVLPASAVVDVALVLAVVVDLLLARARVLGAASSVGGGVGADGIVAEARWHDGWCSSTGF